MAGKKKLLLPQRLALQGLAVILVVAAAALVFNQSKPSESGRVVNSLPAADSAGETAGRPAGGKVAVVAPKPLPAPAAPASGSEVPLAAEEKALPRLLDLGATSCVPCKMMEPVLEGLRKDYAGKFQVEFIDVWENSSAGVSHRIRVIPTQIFFDASGNELFRHEGFMSREDILAKWRELGYDFAAGAKK